jgi:hypothetical protein
MKLEPTAVVCVLFMVGCAGGANSTPLRAPPPVASQAAPAPHEDPPRVVAKVTPDASSPNADQIAALKRAISLYEQFIQRAGNSPEYEDAVRRSRERIEDAKATITFLESTPPQ